LREVSFLLHRSAVDDPVVSKRHAHRFFMGHMRQFSWPAGVEIQLSGVFPCPISAPPDLKLWSIFLINGVRSSDVTRSKQRQLKLSILATAYLFGVKHENSA
jgi:hypothetical protein